MLDFADDVSKCLFALATAMFVVPDRKLFQEIVEFKEDTSKYDNRCALLVVFSNEKLTLNPMHAKLARTTHAQHILLGQMALPSGEIRTTSTIRGTRRLASTVLDIANGC